MTQGLIQKVKIFYSGLLGRKKEEDGIPEHWKNVDSEDVYIEVEDDIPTILVEPTFSFKKDKLHWLKIKRIMAFVLLVVSIVSIVGFIQTYSPALAYYIPTSVILLDYLVRTRESKKPKWYILDDMEDIN